MAGLFITMEGCEGAGKTLQCKKLAACLSERGLPALLTREPGGNRVSERIREIILDTEHKNMSARAEALLYSASRAQLVAEIISPALAEGKIVVCDRFTDSSVAYQGCARGLGAGAIKQINGFATGYLNPDVTFFLDVDPSVSFARKRNDTVFDRIELEKPDFHHKVYEGYLGIAKSEPGRVFAIDARKNPDAVHGEILSVILPIIEKKFPKGAESE